jgi:hypothetical protein
MKRKFAVEFDGAGGYEGTAIIELDQKVIDVVDDDWRKHLYQLHTPEEIAEHIAYNLIVNNIPLTLMDGWADLSDDMARVVEYPDEVFDELEAREIEN